MVFVAPNHQKTQGQAVRLILCLGMACELTRRIDSRDFAGADNQVRQNVKFV